MEDLNIGSAPKGRVVIVGGGFGGIALARALGGSELQVVMVDRNNYHQFQPLLYQVATSGLEPTAISFPIRGIFRYFRNVNFRMATATGVDSEKNILHTSVGDLRYDHLVLAAGADTAYFGMQSIEENALPLKSVGEALALRNHIYKTMERATRISDAAERADALTFVIVGGGATGVELAGAIAELRKSILPKDFFEIDFSTMRVVLLNAGQRLLENFSELSSSCALRDLTAMGVQVVLNAKVSGYDDGCVVFNDDERIRTQNLIWASGVAANKIDGVPSAGRSGRIKVDSANRVEGYSNIYAIGDQAIMANGHPQVAQVAIQQGDQLAKNLLRLARNQPLVPFVYKDKGSMATIGRGRAVAEINGRFLSGFMAWVMWLFVHLLFIVGARNRFTVVWDWAWSYITRDQPLRSIIVAVGRSSGRSGDTDFAGTKKIKN